LQSSHRLYGSLARIPASPLWGAEEVTELKTNMKSLSNVWATRSDIVMIVAIAMMIADPLRVLPQMFNDIYGGATNEGYNLTIGIADIIGIAVFALIRPELWSIVCMTSGLVIGLAAKSLGAPALPGWFLMFAPWVIRNWRHVTFSSVEKRYMWIAFPAVFGIWATLLFTGHIVDPTMQGPHSVGWVYTTNNDPVTVDSPVQATIRPGVYLTRRVRSIKGESVTLSADNPDFGELSEDELLTVPVSSIKPIAWTFSPRRLVKSYGSKTEQARNSFEFHNAVSEIGCYLVSAKSDHVLVLHPSGEIKRIEGKYQTHTSTILRLVRDGVTCLVDLKMPDSAYVQTDALLMSWYGPSYSRDITIKAKRAMYGVEFSLPHGQKLFIRALLPPESAKQ